MRGRILFINAINTKNPTESSLPPLGLGYLASSLRKEFGIKSIKFKIIDKNFEEEISNFSPDIVGITSVSQNYNLAINLAKTAKKYKFPVIVGGTHISILPQTLTADMDVAVIGEGEETIIDLFDFYKRRGRFNPKDLRNIRGIAFRESKKIILTKPRNLIEPLDKIPMPARDLMKIENPTHMFSSRGCPYRCRFCASSRFWDKVRFFSAEYVVEEIKYLFENYRINHIGFWDDLFIADRQRLKEIIALLKNEGILDKLTFGCTVRSNLVNEGLANLLQQMNVKRTSMGLESASPLILKYLKGENIKISHHFNAIKILKKYGIEPSATFIIGSPKETKAEILKTLNFIKKSQLHGFTVYVLTPFPGTPVWEEAKSKGLVNENMDWSLLDVEFARNHRKALILSEKLTREELYELFLRFKQEEKRRLLIYALKNPLKIPGYLLWEIKRRLPKIPCITPLV